MSKNDHRATSERSSTQPWQAPCSRQTGPHVSPADRTPRQPGGPDPTSRPPWVQWAASGLSKIIDERSDIRVFIGIQSSWACCCLEKNNRKCYSPKRPQKGTDGTGHPCKYSPRPTSLDFPDKIFRITHVAKYFILKSWMPRVCPGHISNFFQKSTFLFLRGRGNFFSIFSNFFYYFSIPLFFFERFLKISTTFSRPINPIYSRDFSRDPKWVYFFEIFSNFFFRVF